MRAGWGKLNVTITNGGQGDRGSPCVQWVVSRTLGAADKTDNSGRVVAHAMLHIEGHILLSITGYHRRAEHVAEG